MSFNLLEQFGITDLIGLYNTFLNQKQIRNEIDNKELAEMLLKCTRLILERLGMNYEAITNGSENIDIERSLRMRELQVVIDHMHDTLEEGYEYYRDYVIFKDTNPKMAKTALDMANIHVNQLYARWHDIVVYMINDFKQKGNTIPEVMQKMYDYEHQKLTEDFDELAYKIKTALSNM